MAAGPGDVAVGQGAQVLADQGSAYGAGAVVGAGHTNAAAFGAGAATTRANQQVFGTEQNTYTMTGIASNASRQAQGTPSYLVTSNAGGDLAAYTPGQLGLATSGDISGLQGQINGLGRRDNELTEGIATSFALAQPILEAGQRFGMTAAWGSSDEANAIGFSAAGVLARDLLRPGSGTLALFGGLGVGTKEGQAGGRAGISFGW
jgi:hypothetical protein